MTKLTDIRTMKSSDRYSTKRWSASDREEVIVLIDDFHWTDNQILRLIPNLTTGSIAAFRAHATRGTYNKGVKNGASRKGTER